ncbi:hypothetical protein [Pectobacterium brasiliense]|uniref:hypothetical protein n=1 Tax=Pectobacterium brasiliense TaxID=180957 RepID=UPI001969397F|nr:hypothetical protein [Pectobacterium brasiliense]MBN3265102.1 hypothetical protein [Pectobacterium brasiliense]
MADIELLTLRDEKFYKTADRVIFKDYKCNCTKGWKDADKFMVYKADESGVTEIFSDEVGDSNLDVLIDLARGYLSERVVISGGHTVVNLDDRFSVSNEVEKSAKFCIDYIVKSKEQLSIQPDFLMEINDFYMEKNDGHEIDGANQYRKMATSPYIIPERINAYINEINKSYGINIRSFYVSEKTMADRFKRHIRNTVDKNILFKRQENDLLMTVDEHTFAIIQNNKPTCAAGNAATFRAIRYRVSANKIFDNYTSHIGVFPLCSRINVLNGYRAASSFYDNLTLPSLLVFFGKSCFE